MRRREGETEKRRKGRRKIRQIDRWLERQKNRQTDMDEYRLIIGDGCINIQMI